MIMPAVTQSVPRSATIDDIRSWLDAIPDPEVPAISIVDLGIVRDVRRSDTEEGGIVVTITPTYSGCPAMSAIEDAIVGALRAHGVPHVEIETRLSPPWTTEWLSPSAKERLRRYGIAPPRRSTSTSAFPVTFVALAPDADSTTAAVACPRCGSSNTECISAFGSTACKAQYRCRDCLEPFDYFKPI
jgi:ring-1,2-phenylacetyl-CoA epoxidase subunit PaaD